MFTWILKRISDTDNGTFGVLIDEYYIPFLVTLERPWIDNQHDISCIPVGTYKCKRTQHLEHGECFQVMDVEDRSAILIHSGNTIKDSKGCILLGKEFGKMFDGVPSIMISKEAVNGVFMKRLLGVDEFNLRIISCDV